MSKIISEEDYIYNFNLNEWIYERLMKRAEQYVKDAEDSMKMGWKDCAISKVKSAEFCMTLANHIRLGIQKF